MFYRVLSIISGTVAVLIALPFLDRKEIIDGYKKAFLEIWLSFMIEHPSILEQEELMVEVLVWNFTERFVFFPKLRRDMFDVFLKTALHKWRWERGLKGIK